MKFIKYIPIFFLLLLLCACENINVHPKIKIGMSIPSNSTFIKSICQSAQKEAEKNYAILDISFEDNNHKKQEKQIKEWAEDGYAAVIVILCDETKAQSILNNAGVMPVVFLNHCPTDSNILKSRQNVIYIGGKESEAGKLQGKFFSEYFLSAGNTTPTIAVIHGDDKYISKTRIEAAKNEMTAQGLMPFYVYESKDNWDKEKTSKNFSKFLSKSPSIDAVLAANDEMAIGAAEALSKAGYALSNIPIAGANATEEGRSAIREGKLAFTVYQNPDKQGAGAIKQIMLMLGGDVPDTDKNSIQLHDFTPITPANLDTFFYDIK